MHRNHGKFARKALWRHALGRWPAGLLTLALVGCGGGGGGGSPVAAPNTPPTVNAGADQTVARNLTVSLNGSASDNGGSAGLSYSWQQSAGTSVTLTGADRATATFTSPDVSADEVLSFTLTVTDSAGASGDDSVAITVLFNAPPSADAGADQIVQQNDTVTLSGAATDDNGPLGLTYQWTQVAGTPVTLVDPDTAVATFTAPPTTTSQVLEFRLTVTDANGEADSDDVVIEVFNDLSAATISGKAEYQFVPFAAGGLNYGQQQIRPIRGATIQLVDATSNAVLDATALDDQGEFVFSAPISRNVFLRVRAELKRVGTPSWDVEVRDNTSNTGLPLGQRPLYVLDGSPFNTGIGAQTVNLQALSGWTGSSYGNTRASAPFSIIDIVYNAMQMVVDADPNANFAPLDAFWSVNNSPTISSDRNFDTGELGTSFYRGDLDSLFLLGEENSDTEEFDTHVVAHEWGHYFEDNFSRSDSIGGSHSLSDRLDPRLAFGEGFGNAISAMVNQSGVYYDTQGTQQGTGFSFNLEANSANASTRGWFNERSIQVILYDIYDDAQDTGDSIALGFGPIYDVLVNEQAAGTPFTTIFSFIEALRARNPSIVPELEVLLQTQRISANSDAYGDAETEDAGRPAAVLPVYTVVTPNGGAANVCSSNFFDPDEDGNKLSVRRFVRIPVSVAGDYQVSVVTTNPIPGTPSDPDAFVFRGGFVVGGGDSPIEDSETFTLPGLMPGDYVMSVFEWSYLRDGSPAIVQPDSQTCFDITVTS